MSANPTPDSATQEAGKETGPFLTLLTEVFGALNIKADPVRQAREAIAAMDKITDKQ
jgi:hypothetical protein